MLYTPARLRDQDSLICNPIPDRNQRQFSIPGRATSWLRGLWRVERLYVAALHFGGSESSGLVSKVLQPTRKPLKLVVLILLEGGKGR